MILLGDWAPGQKHGELHLVGQEPILANLEGPILLQPPAFQPMPKAGPHIYSLNAPSTSRSIVWALANNHTMDYGAQGLEATLGTLRDKGFQAVGAGENVAQARRPIVILDNDVRVGIISCCEAQFGIATSQKAGVAEFGPWVFRAIQQLRAKVDVVIVSVHAGLEHSPWPSPSLQALFRSWIQAGAAVVHGHHAHIPQGIEEYEGGLIAYGMGNLLVPPHIWRNMPNALWSLGLDITLTDQPIQWRAFSLEIREDMDGKIHAEASLSHENREHLEYMRLCSRPLGDSILLEGLWQELSLRAYFHHYARHLNFADGLSNLGTRQRLGFFVRSIPAHLGRMSGVKTKTLSKRKYLLWYNLFACQSHQDALRTALGLLSGELEDVRTGEVHHLVDEMLA